VDPSLTVPIDRSTGVVQADRVGAMAALGRHARRFVLASVALLVAACSQLQLGYNNADTVIAYALDSYLDLDDEQERLARERIGALHRWHRGTQLPGYAKLLGDAQRKLSGQVTAAEVREFNAGIRRALIAIGEQTAPDLAALALTLKPAQLDRMAGKLARDTVKARAELVSLTKEESVEHRVERYVERTEEWFGRLSTAQQEMIRTALSRQPGAQEAWIDERERRQRELVAVMARIYAEQPSPAIATAWLREYFARLDDPRDPQQRARLETYRQEDAALVASLINSATPPQRAKLAKKLGGYVADFDALAVGAPGRRDG